jgi:polysaccharide export outer membrane protein
MIVEDSLSGMTYRRFACGTLMTALALLLAACAGGPTVTEAPAAPQGAGVASPEYRIGPGDNLNVYVFNQPELTTNVQVRPDGLVSTPLVENMQAAGKTPSQLGRDIEKVLAEYVRSPKVNIIVTGFVGTYGDQIRVVGQAAHPQSLPYRNGMTVLDVVIAVGGLGEFAAGNRAHIVRHEGTKQIEMKIRLDDLVQKGDITANVAMQPGDVLIIPQSRF